jgi:hypothetical protein
LCNGQDQNLQFFVTKIFYLLRRTHNEADFDFYFEHLMLKPDEVDCRVLKKLCDWDFYVEELSEVYFRQFKRIILHYFTVGSSSNIIIETLKSASVHVKFEYLSKLLLELGNPKIKSFLSLWTDAAIPINSIESALAASFPENDIIISFSDICEKIVPSESLKNALNEKSKGTKYDLKIWKNFVQFEDYQSDSDLNNNYISSGKNDISVILVDINSEIPANIAFGLYSLRKTYAENSSAKIDSQLLNSVISCLFHEERLDIFSIISFDFLVLCI